MRTNIVINDQLMQEAFLYAPAPVGTKRELIDMALREFVENHKRRDVRELRGKIKIAADYDYKALRANRSDK